MKKYFFAGLLVSLSLSMCFLTGFLSAQEQGEKTSSLGLGIVTEISAGQVVVSEYDEVTAAEVSVSYDVDQAVKLENLNSLEDLKEGDFVAIEYTLENGKRTAKIITAEEVFSSEEMMGDEQISETEEVFSTEEPLMEEPVQPSVGTEGNPAQ